MKAERVVTVRGLCFSQASGEVLSQWGRGGRTCFCAGLKQRRSWALPVGTPELPGALGSLQPSSCRRAATATMEGGKAHHQVPFFSFPKLPVSEKGWNPCLVQAGLFNGTPLGILGKYWDDLIRALFCHSIHNCVWEGISTASHKNWDFPLKSFSCSFTTFVQQ